MTKPEECVMCSAPGNNLATGRLFNSFTYCSWCELGDQKQKEHDLTKLVMPKKNLDAHYVTADEVRAATFGMEDI